jgi:two-component system CheB/CheR fusion protein
LQAQLRLHGIFTRARDENAGTDQYMKKTNSFLTVGIGASAGGIEAMEGFFSGVPQTPGIAFVIVTHLSPDRESMLHEIIGRYTSLPVHVATDGLAVEADNVYVLPTSAILSIKQGRLHLRRNVQRRERKPIDVFLASLAIDARERSAGVILSGGDADGTLGLKTIKEHGGITMAQTGDGSGPKHPDMPTAAITAGFVDFALPVEDMGRKLVELANVPDISGVFSERDASGEDRALLEALPELYALLRNQVGHDFSGYKKKTFVRRVQRRMQIKQLQTMGGYLELLRQNPQEVAALFRDLLINVTNFFRDEEAFETLAREILPKLFHARGANDVVRIWVPGCATGEEVYSLGMLVREQMERMATMPRVQIFGTDIDEHALVAARAARYPEALLEHVSPERRKRFFIADAGSFVVTKDVRELCIFSPHSLIRDPPFSRMDLISCRNLLIYFGPDIQRQVIPTFHYALRPEGYLFLGSAENVSQFDDLFTPVDKRHRIFRRRSDTPSSLRLPANLASLHAGHMADLVPRRVPLSAVALRQAVDQQVLERHAPPHVVVNRDGDVVFFSSRTGKYLEPPAGAPTRQLLTMARRDLRLDLRSLFREAVESGKPVARESVTVETEDGRIQMINLSIEPLNERGAGEPLFLVMFTDQGPLLSREEALDRQHARHDGASIHMEQELREARDRLQSMIEEYETALEELKSSNEELVSVNEEMQSTNEELEASKEELQSVNEELHTVNAELHGKIEALDRANSDMVNLFESTNVATVFLDESLVIRSFTPAVGKIFNILPGDRGRPITDLANHLNLARFADDIRKVFEGGGRGRAFGRQERSLRALPHSHCAVRRRQRRDPRRRDHLYRRHQAHARHRTPEDADLGTAASHAQPAGAGAGDRAQDVCRDAGAGGFFQPAGGAQPGADPARRRAGRKHRPSRHRATGVRCGRRGSKQAVGIRAAGRARFRPGANLLPGPARTGDQCRQIRCVERREWPAAGVVDGAGRRRRNFLAVAALA